ncbi:MAG TPA: hypothetical protein GXZ24_05735 [Firmicutes bacterium]|nr:hypothetical protein [Bacillota bacterium]
MIHSLHKISLQQRWQETKGAPEKTPSQDKIPETINNNSKEPDMVKGASSITADPTKALRINNSLRQLTTTISRISRQRSNLEGRINNLKQSLELLLNVPEDPTVSDFPARRADHLQKSLSQIRQQIQREGSLAVMAHHNLDQQRVLDLLYDQKTGTDDQPG